ncbi:MAG: WYL domain-containing protein [Actinobacteria bacterium]|nr:MAG: WYL domain-containing protein [Actinomycetota bacterium]
MIAVDAHTPLERVRRKLEDTFGQFELAQAPEPQAERADAEEDLVSTLARGMREHRLVEIEYQKESDAQPSTRVIEPYKFERALPWWYVHTWDRTSDGERSFRLDRMRSAKLTKEKFAPRADFEPTRLRDARRALVLYTPAIARYEIERGARRLTDKPALKELQVGSEEWLESEILSKRGDAVVLEPSDRRAGARAREGARRRASPRCAGLAGRQRQREGRPRIRGRANVERAAVGLRDRARDEEAEPGAGLGPAGDVGAPELLEDEPLLIERDSGTAVDDRDAHGAVLRLRPHLDLLADG